MFVKQLELVSFRNHRRLLVDLEPVIYRIIGANGTGKTNFLESIYVSLYGRSFRTHVLKEVISFDNDFSYLASTVEIDGFYHDLELTIKENVKEFRRDNNVIKRVKNYSRGMGVVVFEPKHLQMVQGSPSMRRNFLDELLRMTSPSYEEAYSGYYHVLYQRNYVLRKLKEPSLLDVYDLRLAQFGAVILKERLKFLKRMSPVISDYYKDISGGREVLDIRYKTSFPIHQLEDLEGAFYESLKTSRLRDHERSRTSIGPHLDDVSFLLDGVEAKKFSSTGQIRSIVLALKCMEIDRARDYLGSDPVVLLDDVMSEIDDMRREMLLSKIGGQCFITAAEAMEALERYSRPMDIESHAKSGLI